MRRSGVAVGIAFLSAVLAGQGALGGPGAPQPAGTASPSADIRRITLENGLRIYVLERTSSPTFAALYQFDVGGASDPRGKSGIAHLLEHMMFKGSRSIGTLDADKELPLLAKESELWRALQEELDREDDPFRQGDAGKIAALRKEISEVTDAQAKLTVKGEFEELVARAGAVSTNASTGNDATTYYLQLPGNRLETWFRLESDRLLNPVFREFYSERDVVQEERRLRIENSPAGMAREALDSLMFAAHPYGTPVIGWPRDLQRLVREDALAYFTTYYSPSNCVMVLVGDVKVAEVERLAKKYLGSWKRQQMPPRQITAEPEQRGERRRVVEFDAEPQLRVGWPTVPEGHADQCALDVLGSVLGGLESSRLDKTAVQRDRIAVSVSTVHDTMRYAGSFVASAVIASGFGPGDFETAVEREIARIQDEGITAEELERAKIGVEVGRVASLKNNLGQAFRIATSVTVSGRTDYAQEYERRIQQVTAEEVKQAARKYLQPTRKNVVEIRKSKGGPAPARGGAELSHGRGGTEGKRGERHSAGFLAVLASIRADKPIDLKVPEIGKDVGRIVLPSGITVFIKEDHGAPSIEMSFAWLGGSNTTPVADLAPFELCNQLLNQGGTAALDPAALEERREELGMRFGVSIGSTQSGASFWSLERNFGASFDLAVDILLRPRLDPARLEVIKGQYIEGMRRRYDSPGIGASVLRDHVFYADHPRLGYVASRQEIAKVTPEQIRGIWKRYLGKSNLYITVVGDFDRAGMLDRIERSLGAWRDAEDPKRVWITREPVVRPGAFLVEKEVAQPAIRIAAQVAVDRRAPREDHAALEILNDVLGGSGFRSRLVERLRSQEGLTYGISSSVSHEGRPGVPGAITISYQTKKGSVLRSVRSVVEEFGKVIQEPVGTAEVAEQIEAWRNRFIFGYTNDFYTVSRLMFNELDDVPYDWDRIELEAVQRVGVEDVQRVARKYLKPENLTVAIFGTPTDEDRSGLVEWIGLKVFPKAEIFRGGYDEASGSTGGS
jgi:predicted Zn-dependent peptidase